MVKKSIFIHFKNINIYYIYEKNNLVLEIIITYYIITFGDINGKSFGEINFISI